MTNFQKRVRDHKVGRKKRVTLSIEMTRSRIYNLINNYKNYFKENPNIEIVVYSKAPDSANVPLAGSDDSSPPKDRVVGFSQQIRFLYFRRLPSRHIPILFYPQVSPTISFKIFTIIMVI